MGNVVSLCERRRAASQVRCLECEELYPRLADGSDCGRCYECFSKACDEMDETLPDPVSSFLLLVVVCTVLGFGLYGAGHGCMAMFHWLGSR